MGTRRSIAGGLRGTSGAPSGGVVVMGLPSGLMVDPQESREREAPVVGVQRVAGAAEGPGNPSAERQPAAGRSGFQPADAGRASRSGTSGPAGAR